MRILVAGGTGVLGRRVCRLLAGGDHQVWATSRRPDRADALRAAGCHPLVMDAMDADATDRAVAAAAPELIVHLLTDLAGADFAGNAALRVTGTANLVLAARRHGVQRMIAESISWVYAPGESPAAECTPMARTDSGDPAFSEVQALELSVLSLRQAVVLRFGLLYGPGTWYAPGGAAFSAAADGRVTATTDHTSFVHVDDAARAVVDAMDWPAGVVNIVDDEPTDAVSFGRVLIAAAGGELSNANITTRATGRAASNALAASLGWRPRHRRWSDTGFGS